MIVVVSTKAAADLETIRAWIARDSPRRALSFVLELRQRCQALGDTPFAYPLLPRYEQSGIRRRAYQSYLIFYRVAADAVEILRVLHGARDYERILFPA